MKILHTTLLVSVAALLFFGASSVALAADATIGLYSDSNGYSCNFSGNSNGIVNAYVVIRPGTAGVRGVRFSAPLPPCFGGTFISETAPDVFAFIGSSQTGISISSRNCENEPFYALQITYLMGSNTTPCCEFPIVPDPSVGFLEAVDCAYNETPIHTVVSHFNANETCPCGSIFPPPAAPSQPFPANFATNVSLDPTLFWVASDPSGLALSYDLYFGADTAPQLVASNVALSGAPSYIPGHLAESTTYYWQVVMRNTAGSETAGPLWVFTTVGPPPPPPTNHPPMVTNTAPADGSMTTVNPVLNWAASDPDGDALKYSVYFGTSSSPPLVASNLTVSPYRPARLPFDTRYWWRIEARDPYGLTGSGPTWSFTTESDPPPTVTTSSPVCGSTTVALAPTLTWTASEPYGESIVTYDVYFGTGPFPPLVASDLTAKSYPVSGLEYATTYSWRVVAHDSGGQQASSTLCMFTTKAANEPPTVPSNPAPVDGAINQAANLNLSWQSSDPEGQALTYDVYLGKTTVPTSGASIGLYTDAAGSTCSFAGNPSGVVNTYVVVKPQNAGIRGVRFAAPIPSCLGGTFLYDNVPSWLVSIGASQSGISISSADCQSQPFYVLQIGYMANGNTTSCCEFAMVPDPIVGHLEAVDCSFADTPLRTVTSHFNADISCPCGSSTLPRIASNIKTKILSVSSLVLGSYYEWRVVARDAGGLEAAGPTWSFQTAANRAPAVPSSPSPANGAINVVSNPTLTWQATDPEGQQLKYDVYFGTSADPPLVKSNATTKSYTPATLAWVTTYWWRIVARDTYGATTSSPTWSFTTKPENLPPAVPVAVAPSNGGTNLPVNSSLAWTGSDPEGQSLKYDVYFGTAASPPLVSTNQTTTEYFPLTLAISTTYRWRVVAHDTGALETSSPTWSFTTSSSSNQAPHVGTSPAPADGAYTEKTNLVLEWYAYDPDNDPLTYIVYGGPDYNPFLFYAQTSERKLAVGPLQPGTTYHWSVTVMDGHWQITGPTWSFYVSGGSIPVLFSSFDATARSGSVEIRWALASDEAMEKLTVYRREGATGTSRVVMEGAVSGVKGSFIDRTAEPAKTYRYDMVVHTASGDDFRSSIATVTTPDLALTLHQNQPNPFNPQTTIRYDLPGGTTRVRLLIVDASGRRVRTLVDEAQTGGARSVMWNGRDDNGNAVASGVYFFVLDAGKERLTKKMVLLK